MAYGAASGVLTDLVSGKQSRLFYGNVFSGKYVTIYL